MHKVGIDVDILGLSAPRTGIPNYLAELVSALLRLHSRSDRLEFVLFSRRQPVGLKTAIDYAQVVVTATILRLGWRQLALPLAAYEQRVHLLHMPAFSAPVLSPCPIVLTVHDLAYLAHPGWFSARTLHYLRIRVGMSVMRASAIITDSTWVREHLISEFEVDPARVFTVHLGVSPRFSPRMDKTDELVHSNLGLPRRFFLYAGTIEPRKNLVRLIRAYARCCKAGLEHHLVLAGAKGWLCDEVYAIPEKLGISDRVRFTGYVPSRWLPALYRAADAFVYPSLYEGFGLPPLEAMASGTPVITSNTTSLPEVVGEAALLVDPASEEDIAQAMLRLVSDAGLRDELRARGLIRASGFSWQKAAEQTTIVYETVLSHRTPRGRGVSK